MKNTLLVLFVFVLVLTLTTGCGVKKLEEPTNEGIEIVTGEKVPASPATSPPASPPVPPEPPEPSASGAEGWPTADLSPEIPVYPNGVVTNVYNNKKEAQIIFIELLDTDKDTFMSYITILKADGFEQIYFDDSYNCLSYRLSNSDFFIYAFINAKDHRAALSYEDNLGWPDLDWLDLPAKIPEYTDGVFQGSYPYECYIDLNIYNTSKTAFDKYFDKVVDAGWEFDGTDAVDNRIVSGFKKDNWELLLFYYEGDMVNIKCFPRDEDE
jgi:hypothetical protein